MKISNVSNLRNYTTEYKYHTSLLYIQVSKIKGSSYNENLSSIIV